MPIREIEAPHKIIDPKILIAKTISHSLTFYREKPVRVKFEGDDLVKILEEAQELAQLIRTVLPNSNPLNMDLRAVIEDHSVAFHVGERQEGWNLVTIK